MSSDLPQQQDSVITAGMCGQKKGEILKFPQTFIPFHRFDLLIKYTCEKYKVNN